MARKKKQKAPAVELTEWQKRNLEFQKRKQERLAAKQAEEVSEKGEETVEANPEKDAKQATPKSGQPVKKFKKRERIALAKALPILLAATIVLILSLFMISPLSKQKQFAIQGAVNAQQDQLISETGIKDSDYVSHVAVHLKDYEKQLVKADPWVKTAKITYQFPNRFTITVEEYGIMAYSRTDKGYQPVLESGELVEAVGDGTLPDGALLLPFEKVEDSASFVKQFVTIDPSIRQSVQSISLANSTATPDLLLLTMAEGHTVRIPLSQLALKLPYYKSIKDKLSSPGIIDMEVGVYTTTEDIEASAAETKASREQESREAAALSSTSSSSGKTSTSKTRTETSSSSTDEAD